MLTMFWIWLATKVLGPERTKRIAVAILTSRPVAPLYKWYLRQKRQWKLRRQFSRHYKIAAAIEFPTPPVRLKSS